MRSKRHLTPDHPLLLLLFLLLLLLLLDGSVRLSNVHFAKMIDPGCCLHHKGSLNWFVWVTIRR